MTQCDKCQKELVVGEWPFCPHGMGNSNVIPDDIPGGIEIRNGLCNPDGSPRRYYSKTEINAEAKKRGLINMVTHVTDPRTGSDKNPHTTRWI